MENKPPSDSKAKAMRQRALEIYASKSKSTSSRKYNSSDTLKLLHELEIHQIELELQNEELMRAKEQAEKSAQKYTSLYDFSPAGYFTLSPAGKIIELNLRAAQMLGKERLYLVNRSFGQFVDANSKRIFNNFLHQLFTGNERQVCEVFIITQNNAPCCLYLKGVGAGNGEQCLVTAFDISRRKKAEDELQKSKEHFQLMFDQAPLGYQSLDINGCFLDVNQRWLDMFGYRRKEVIGAWFGDFVTPEYIDAFREGFRFFITESKIHSEFEMKCKDGRIFFISFEGTVAYDQDGRFQQTHCILQDITQRKKAEKELHESHKNFMALFDSIDDFVVIINDQGGIIKSNAAVQQRLGYTEAELTKMTVVMLHPEETREAALKTIGEMVAGITDTCPIPIQHKDGTLIPIETKISKGVWGGENVLFGVSRDTTHRLLLEQLRQREQQRALLQRNTIATIVVDTHISRGEMSVAFSHLTTYAAGALQVERASIWLLSGDNSELHCISLYKSNTQEHSSGIVLKKDDYPHYFEAIKNESRVYADDAQNDPRTSEFTAGYLRPLGITSMLDAGIYLEGRLMGVLCLEHVGDMRRWFSDEESFASTIAAIASQILAGSKRREIMDDLLEERKRLSDVIEGTNAGTWEWNLLTGETVFNDRWADIIGYSLDEITPATNKTWNRFAHPDDLEKSTRLLNKHFRGELDYYDCQVRMKHKNGQWIWTLHRGKISKWSDDGIPLFMSGTHQDISDYKKAEFALKKSEQHAHALIAAIPDLIFMIDGNGVFLDFKPAMSDPSFDPAIMIGKKISQIAPPEIASLVETRIRHILQTGQMHIDEYRIPLPEKGIVDFEARAVCGANKEVIAIVRDISQRKRDEAMILDKNQQLQKLNAEKDKFFSIIAHDLKSPFNAIMGFSELLVERIGEKDYRDVGKYADIILQSSLRAVDLLMNLMEWSRSQTGRMKFKPDAYLLYDIINDIVLLLSESAQQKSIIINVTLPEKLTAFADKDMLDTVIRNLISNAIKFTMPGGRITISAEEKNHEVMVSVSDNGVGIPKEAIKKIFSIQENYTTTGTQNEKGTGLGLILCKEFVEKHGGKIWVESKKEKGTVFTFSLPWGHKK